MMSAYILPNVVKSKYFVRARYIISTVTRTFLDKL